MDPYCVHRKYGVCALKRHRDMKFLKFPKSEKKNGTSEKSGLSIFRRNFDEVRNFCVGVGCFSCSSSNLVVFKNIRFFEAPTSLLCYRRFGENYQPNYCTSFTLLKRALPNFWDTPYRNQFAPEDQLQLVFFFLRM